MHALSFHDKHFPRYVWLVDKINTWFELNKLSLNVKKTNFILFALKRISSINSSHDTPENIVDTSKIEQVHCSKLLVLEVT